MSNMDDVLNYINENRNSATKAAERLKTAVFKNLIGTTAAFIKVEYNGSGDSGSVESVEVTDKDDKKVKLSTEKCIATEETSSTYKDGEWVSVKVDKLISLEQALEELAYLALEGRFPGWEINEGAYGHLEIDVKKQTAILKHNTIIQDTEYDEVSL